MAELSRRSGVPTATVKYYLREGLVPPGRRVSATQAEYGEDDLRRLRLVRALIQLGRMPVATVKAVLAAVEDESLDHHMRIGAAVWALPHGARRGRDDGGGDRDAAAEEDPQEVARRRVDALLERLGWRFGQRTAAASPAYRHLVDAVAGLLDTGYPCEPADLLPYGRLAGELGAHDLDVVERYEPAERQVEAAVAVTVLYEPVVLALRRLAEAEESARRFGRAEADRLPETDEGPAVGRPAGA